MKIFQDNFSPIEIEIKNIKGESYILQSQFMNAEDIKEIENLTKKAEAKKTLNADVIYVLLQKTFGKEEDFFKQFSFKLLGDILTYITEESKKNSQGQNG